MVCGHEYDTVDTSGRFVDIALRVCSSFLEVYCIIFVIYNDDSDKTEYSDFEVLFSNMKM